MHELSLATGLVNAALETAKLNNAKQVHSVTVEVGELAMVNPEQLKFMFDVLTEDNMLKGTELIIEVRPAIGECTCGYKGPVEDRYACSCPKCGMTLKAIEGRDVCLKSMEIEA